MADRTSDVKGKVYTFSKDMTLYKVYVGKLDEEEKRDTGGRFLVSILSPGRGSYGSYCFNSGYNHPSYVKEKFPDMTYRDAETIAAFLNDLLL